MTAYLDFQTNVQMQHKTSDGVVPQYTLLIKPAIEV